MPRLIDKYKLESYFTPALTGRTEYSADEILFITGTMPTVDAVEVVRCKDCRWYYIFNGHDRCDLLDLEARDIKPDWYCADGERKEDETN